jgi:hypothetical protein
LINQRLKDRSRPSDFVHVPVLIRFLMPATDIPKPPGSSVASDSVHESRSRHSRRGPPSVIDSSVRNKTPPVLAATNEDQSPPSVDVGTNDDPAFAAPTFRGQLVDTRPTGGHGPPMAAGRFQTPPRRGSASSVIQLRNDNSYWNVDPYSYSYASFFGRSDLRCRIV